MTTSTLLSTWRSFFMVLIPSSTGISMSINTRSKLALYFSMNSIPSPKITVLTSIPFSAAYLRM